MAEVIETVGVVGAGAWGTALATVASRAGRRAIVWARETEVAASINENHENTLFLPGIRLAPEISATNDYANLADADALLLVCPAQATRVVASALAPHVEAGTPVVICAKGIEQQSGALLSDVLSEALPQAQVSILSGPSFAADVAHGLPTAVTLASASMDAARQLADALAIPSFRPYLSDDIVGAQVGGALKNVLAIACGIVEGKGFGASARAALTARAFAELQRFGVAQGAKLETLGGLSGLGDLILTCNSAQSRNMSLGLALGQGRTMEEVLAERNSVSEGVHTSSVVVEMAQKLGIDLPISTAVHNIVSGAAGVDDTIENLLTRPIRTET
ncbi:MAG: NAD(P)-dependent glycerol-3-phosphate dehydrogenase [Alphaproteobacteria bacterium]|nr:NAD(P)-dependent glycerol-3-phosphate dehydrogenase [Alphaproteobacteria bacterium]